MDSFTREPAAFPPDTTYRRPISAQQLLQAYSDAAGRRAVPPPTQASFSAIMAHRVVSVASQIIYVLRRLWTDRRISYRTLFVHKKDRSEIVATFLAVLELVKGKRVRVEGDTENPTVELLKAGERKCKRKH